MLQTETPAYNDVLGGSTFDPISKLSLKYTKSLIYDDPSTSWLEKKHCCCSTGILLHHVWHTVFTEVIQYQSILIIHWLRFQYCTSSCVIEVEATLHLRSIFHWYNNDFSYSKTLSLISGFTSDTIRNIWMVTLSLVDQHNVVKALQIAKCE